MLQLTFEDSTARRRLGYLFTNNFMVGRPRITTSEQIHYIMEKIFMENIHQYAVSVLVSY